MSTTISNANLTVTAGPDKGQVFPLTEEFVHIGSGSDSQVLLTDPQAPEHLASLANRNGRYAIFTPIENAVSVDGNALKPDQWVWLPSKAVIKVTSKTTLTFTSGGSDTTTTIIAPSASAEAKLPEPTPATASPTATTTVKTKSAEKRRGRKGDTVTTRSVAKFITDKPGETLVRLGEDGHLPELALQEATAPKVDKTKPSQGNPVMVYAALGFSLLASVAMLMIDPTTLDEKATSKASARQEIIKTYIGDENGPVAPYQRQLREAGLAHSRGDYAGERNAYLNVLALLNSEDKNPYTGITGSPATDEDLRKYLAVLLAR